MIDVYYIIDDLAAHCTDLKNAGADDARPFPKTLGNIALSIIKVLAKEGYCHGDGGLMAFDGKRYVVIDAPEMKKILSGLIMKLNIGVVYLIDPVDKIYKAIIQTPLIKEFVQQKGIVALRNVVLDMDTMQTYPLGAQWMTRTYMDIDYDPLSTCDWWRRWLTEMVVDSDSIAVMQEFFGMAFIDRNRISIECMLFLYGKGSNGKSVVQQVITGVLGEDACDSAELSQVCTNDYHAADINGKLLNFSSDMGDKDFSSGTYKSIISHQPIKVRPIYRDPFTARDMPVFAACVNKIPVTKDSSDGYWRRNKIILFDKIISEAEQDKYLSKKIIAAEASGILNWLMEGRTRLLARNGQFTESKRIMETVAEARTDSSSVLSWLRDSMYSGQPKAGVPGEEIRKHNADVVEEYQAYCHKTGCMAKKPSNLKDDMEQAGMVYEKHLKVDGKVSTGWRIWRMEYDVRDVVGGVGEKQETYRCEPINTLPF